MDIKTKTTVMRVIAMIGVLSMTTVNVMALMGSHFFSHKSILIISMLGLVLYISLFFPAEYLRKKHGLIKPREKKL